MAFSPPPRGVQQPQEGRVPTQGMGSMGMGQGLPTPGGTLPNAPQQQQQAPPQEAYNPYSEYNVGDGNPWVNGTAGPGSILPPGKPSEQTRDAFLPDVFREPFLDGLRAAGTVGSYAGQALPDAANFQQGLYSAGMNPMEQSFMQSSAYLGQLGLEQAMNNVNNQYSTTPFASSKNKMYADAANQYGAQILNTGSKLALDRQSLATQNLPNVFGTPMQAAQLGQESSSGFYNALEKGMYGDLDLPYSMWSGYPVQGSTYIQQPTSGGK